MHGHSSINSHPTPVVPIHSVPNRGNIKPSDRKYESKGVSTEVMKPIPVHVDESIISLLLKHHNKMTGKRGSYVPLSMCTRQASQGKIGDGPYYLGCILDKLSQGSPECARCIEEIYTKLSPPLQKKTDTQVKEER